MVSVKSWRTALVGCVLTGGVAGGFVSPATAFDPFGWFRPAMPEVSATSLAYSIEFDGLGSDRDAVSVLQDVSLLYRLRLEPPQNGDELLRRAEADLPRIVDALWGSGYYAARAVITVGGQTLTLGQPVPAGLASRIDRFRGQSLVPVRIVIEPGPVYSFRSVEVRERRSGRPFDPRDLPPRLITLKAGDPARSSSVLTLAAGLSDHFRDRSHPFVKVTRRAPEIDHRAQAVDLVLLVDPGPRAGLGPITVSGPENFEPDIVRSFIYAEEGDPYSPRALADIRKSVSRIEALGAVRVREAEELDANGNLPITVEVTDRLPRLIGGSVRYSTVDGPSLRAYWAHRNLFGGAERLRLDADLSYFTGKQNWIGGVSGRGFDGESLGGRVALSFLKPALGGSRTDLLVDAYAQRELTEFYTSQIVNATVALRRRFSDTFSVSAGIEGEIGRARTPLGESDYGMVGVPLSVVYDSTDRPLDPTTGYRISASIAPYAGFGSAPSFFTIGRVQASAYYALDEEARYILAGRVAFGSIMGGTLQAIPAGRRFYAGGGGSVRGYEYKSLGPRDALGYVSGGRSLFEASVEARIKITETIGIVPFFDMGQAYASSFPDGSAKLRYAAGLGLRYYTAVGPIRVDVALPLERRKGEAPYGLYVSIGQAF